MRSARPIALTPAEGRFRFAEWISANMAVIERSGPEWLCSCPMCGGDKLAVHVSRKAFQCLRASCGFRSWRPTFLVAAVLGVRMSDAEALIAAESSGIPLGPLPPLQIDDDPARPKRRITDLPVAALPLMHWGLLPTQQAYVRSRGISDHHAAMFGLSTVLSDGAGTKADRLLSGRVLFPVWVGGRLVFWAARALGDHKAKVINLPRSCREEAHGAWCACYHAAWGLPQVPQAATAGEIVLGLHLVVPGRPVYVVEGPVDAAVCGPQFVATLGAHLTPQQAMRIAYSGASEAIVLFDGDVGGRDAAPKAAATLDGLIDVRYGTCPDGWDPGAMGRERSIEWASRFAPLGATPPLEDVKDRPQRFSHRPSFIAGLQK